MYEVLFCIIFKHVQLFGSVIRLKCVLKTVHGYMQNRTFAKHLQNVLEPPEVDGSKTFLCFISHATTVYLQAVFDPAEKCFPTVLQMF